METSSHIAPKGGDVLLLVGTMKGAFLLCSNRARQRWQVSGPHFPGHTVYALAYDGRQGRQRLWAGTKNFAYGALLRSSDDFGRHWTNPETAPIKFPEDTGVQVPGGGLVQVCGLGQSELTRQGVVVAMLQRPLQPELSAQAAPGVAEPVQVPPIRLQAGVVSGRGWTSSHSKTTSSTPNP